MENHFDRLSLCEPFKRLDDDVTRALLEKADIRTIKTGDTIVEKSRNFSIFQYLLEGNAEIRNSFFERDEFSAEDNRAFKALELLCEPGIPINASNDCLVAKFFKSEVEAAIAGNSASKPEASKPKVNNDWMELFLMSPLVSHLDATGISELMANIKDIPVKKGQLVIKPGVPGDCFYVIKEGTALVKPMGSTDKTIFKLQPGAQFGEEALVAETVRNAKIVMATDGLLGRIHKSFFNSVIKAAVIKRINDDEAASIAADDDTHILDVRLYPEFNVKHRDNAKNLPVSKLRSNFAKLDRNATYLITPEGAKRSELATFLLRQAGFEAFLIEAASQ